MDIITADEAKIETVKAKLSNHGEKVNGELGRVQFWINCGVKEGRNFAYYYDLMPEVKAELISSGYLVTKLRMMERLKILLSGRGLFEMTRYKISW